MSTRPFSLQQHHNLPKTMTELYSQLVPTNDLVKYTLLNPDVDYPEQNIISTQGPIWTPKIFAHELDTLELGGAGKVAFTLSNNHVLDLIDENDVVNFRARDNSSIRLITESSNVSLKLDESTDFLEGFAASNVILTSGLDTKLAVGRDLYADIENDVNVTASNAVNLAAVNGSIVSTAGDTIASTAQNDLSLTSTAADVVVDAGASVLATAATTMQLTTTASNLMLTSGMDITGTAAQNILLDAGDRYELVAGTSISESAPQYSLSSTDLELVASNNATFTASNALDLNAIAGNMTLDGSQDVLITADKNARMTATTQNLELVSGAATTVNAGSSFAFSAATTGSLTAAQDLTIASTEENIAVNADGNLSLRSLTDGDVTISAPDTNKTVIQVGDTNVLEIYKTSTFDADRDGNLTDFKFKINADLEILGTQNSVSVFETQLTVEDKVIHLAFDSNLERPFDGPGNDGSGLVVDGMPETGDPALYDRYEKSIKWHHGLSGVEALGGTSIVDESFWNVRGGGLRISQVDDETGDEVSFGFRINHLQELELYKMAQPFGGSQTVARVAKFGRTL